MLRLNPFDSVPDFADVLADIFNLTMKFVTKGLRLRFDIPEFG